MAHTTAEIIWLRWLPSDLGIVVSHPTPLHCDNKSVAFVVHIAENEVFREWTKHIEVGCHLVRHHYRLGNIYLPFVPTLAQIANFFIKSHTVDRFRIFLSKLSLHFLPREFEGGDKGG